MEKKIHLLSIFLIGIAFCTYAQDWSGVPVPANAGSGKTWQLQSNYSDDFNYSGKGSQFTSNWQDSYINGWDGPGLTEFSSNHSEVSGGNLIIKAARKPGTNKVFCGVISSKTTVQYPVFMEINMKVSGLVLSSNFWLLSEDDRNELDIDETYGSDRSAWFAKRMSTNYHIFERDPVTNDIIANYNDQQFFTLPDNAPLRNDFHRFGAYWKDAWNVEFYLDGVLVRTLTQSGIEDPEGKGLDRPMRIIIDTEDHDWRSNQGIVATDEELANDNINKMFVDWVRVYKPVSTGGGQLVANGTYHIKSSQNSQRLIAPSWDNYNARMHNPGNFSDQRWIINHLGNDLYTIQNQGTGRYLEVPHGGCGNGENVSTWTGASAAHQKWKIEQNGSFYALKPSHCTSTAADRDFGAIDANVHLWGFASGNNNQKWVLEPYSSASSRTNGLASDIGTGNLREVLYPNPARDFLNILFKPDMGYKSLKIIDLLGQTHFNQHLANSDFQVRLEVSNLHQGVYFVMLTGDREKRLIRFIKQ